eukprot:1195468-Prorocentrum_minimum.AAC.1
MKQSYITYTYSTRHRTWLLRPPAQSEAPLRCHFCSLPPRRVRRDRRIGSAPQEMDGSECSTPRRWRAPRWRRGPPAPRLPDD